MLNNQIEYQEDKEFMFGAMENVEPWVSLASFILEETEIKF